MSDLARIDVHGDDDLPVVTVIGEIDLSNAVVVEDRAVRSVPNRALGLVVDLSSTTYLDSSGIHTLFSLARRLSHRQQQLHVVARPGTSVRRVVGLTDLASLVRVYDDLDAAVAAARAGP